MSQILLSEATTEQLYEALFERLDSCVIAGKKAAPSREEEGDLFFGWKGDYVAKSGLINSINSHLKYHDYMVLKDRFSDDPEEYFKAGG